MTAPYRVADVMQILDSLKVVPVWVGPNHLVESARVLMDGHDLFALCVLDRDGRPIGTLRRDVAATIPDNVRVGEVMEPVLGVLNSNETLRQAADLLVRIDRHYAPMMRDGEFRGMVTALDLLDGLRRSWDPMTDLPWSDELRRWGAEQLEEGREIAIVFVDLDRFGGFNKRYGHVVGDRVLTRIADFLRERIDPSLDVLVRYGGDEFAIGTLRSGLETQELAQSLLTTMRETPLMEHGEAIEFSVGVYGGQRQRERDDMHVQATLDDLINFASRRCIASKASATETAGGGVALLIEPLAVPTTSAEAPTAGEDERSATEEDLPDVVAGDQTQDDEAARGPSVVEVQIEDDPNSLTHVVLKGGGRVWVGVGLRLGRTLESTVAYATGKALERANPGLTLRVDAIREESGRVVVKGTKVQDNVERPVRAVAVDDSPEAVADATIAAFMV